MSSIHAPAARNGATAHATDTGGITHFDATLRRKEKMRSRADLAPVAERQTAPTFQMPKPANGRANGHAGNGNGSHATAAPAQVPASAVAPEVVGRPARAASASVPQPAAPEPQPAARPSGVDLERFLIEFVVEQTGYPEEMVELDADLEADLGIDSIKKAQLFGELAEQFNIQATGAGDLSLDDFPTLRHVVEFLRGAATQEPPIETTRVASQPAPSTPAQAPASASPVSATPPVSPMVFAPAPTPAAAVPAIAGPDLEQFLINFVVEQTGYPEEMVELDADLEADLGIDSIKKAQLFGELAEHFEIRTADAADLSLDDFPTLRHVVDFLARSAGKPAATNNTAPTHQKNGSNGHVSPTPQAAPASSHQAGASARSWTPASAEYTHSFAPEFQSADSTPAESSVMSTEELEQFLVNFVVEQTGYPSEMVELDADLEADLGIDSIKKAQLFGELAEQFEIQMADVSELSLDDFPTLRHVMNFLAEAPRRMTV